MIKYIIIDDESIAHDIIQEYCDLLPNLLLQKNCYDALEALQYLNEHKVDLLFLDLNMPKLKGFDFLKTLSNPPKVIVTTAYKEFALEGYELNVADYLLKPFSFERFLKAVNKAVSTSANAAPNHSPITSPAAESKAKRLFLRGDKKYSQIIIDDILYLEAAGNYTKVVMIEETIITRDKLSNVLALLPPDDFLQVHKSFIAATAHIKHIEGNRIVIAHHTLPIGKVYKLNVNRLLGT